MLPIRPELKTPGLFVTATDTDVGKTVATCAIAAALRNQTGRQVSVCKPFASDCRRDREGLVSSDAEALAHFSDCRQPLDVINPIRYAKPLAPAVAIEQGEPAVDLSRIVTSLERLDQSGDFMLVEGVGGLLVPVDDAKPSHTVLDLIRILGYPVAVVCRAGLGTLNHTALTIGALRESGCRVAGVIINGYIPDPGDPMATAIKQSAADVSMPSTDKKNKKGAGTLFSAGSTVSSAGQRDTSRSRAGTQSSLKHEDESMPSNRIWLERMNNVSVLATIPACPGASVKPEKGELPAAILDAVALTFWEDVLQEPEPAQR